MTRRFSIHPAIPLASGRYHLDRYGRLHSVAPTGIRTVAMVVIRHKPKPETAPLVIRREDPPTRPMARTRRPPIAAAPAQDAEPAIDDEAVLAEFAATLKAVQARRVKGEPPASPAKVDTARIAAAHRAKSLGPAPKKAPTRRALADCQCYSCGTRTTIGCDHFLPYLGDTRA